MQLHLLHCMHTRSNSYETPKRDLQLNSCSTFQAQCSIRAPFSLYLMPGLSTRWPCSSKKRPPFRICGAPSTTPDSADHGDKKLMLLPLPCIRSKSLTGSPYNCSNQHNRHVLKQHDKRPVAGKLC